MCSTTAALARPPAASPIAIQLPGARAHRAGPVAIPRHRSAPLPGDLGVIRGRGDAAARVRAAAPSRLGLRILALTATADTPSHLAARAALERIGVPFDVVVAADEPLAMELLYGADGACRYQGIVLATDSLAVEDPATGQWVSALADTEWDVLDGYEAGCGAREVAWYAYPNPGNGLALASSFDADDGVTARLAPAGAARFDYVQPAAAVPIEHVWGYRSIVEDPARTQALVETDDGFALAAVHVRDDGTEVLSMTLDSGTFSTHAQLFEYGVIAWLAKGLFLGERRAYLVPQVDDIFLHTDLWRPDGGEAEYRLAAADIDALVAWQRDLADRMPAGSRLVTQLGFNGAGTLPSVYPDTAPVDALRAVQDEFAWVNHTWAHRSFDELSAGEAADEIATNCELAELWQLPEFSCADAITPHISGLGSADAVRGLLDAGVRHVVSDTSVTAALDPDNPGDNPSHNTGRPNPIDPALFHVPRHPTSIFFSTSTPEEEVGLYNELYREFWGRDLSYDEIIDADSDFGLRYLLTYDIDPLMFHQANLRAWTDADGATRSLYTDWIDRVVQRYAALCDLPILSPDMTEIAGRMQRRAAYDGCGVAAHVEHGADGARTLRLVGAADCVVPITGLDAPAAGEVERYAGVPTTYVALSACEPVDVPLPEAP